jgi:tetratricopeptide (TPR) repeat protein
MAMCRFGKGWAAAVLLVGVAASAAGADSSPQRQRRDQSSGTSATQPTVTIWYYPYNRFPSAGPYWPLDPYPYSYRPVYPYPTRPPYVYAPPAYLYPNPYATGPGYGPASPWYGPDTPAPERRVPPPPKPKAQRKPARKAEADEKNGKKPRDPAGDRLLAQGKRILKLGDADFAKQNYTEALKHYRKAVEVSPGLADAWFRQTFALIALGRYPEAAKALRRGLEVQPDWPGSDFRLDTLYANDQLPKKDDLNTLARAAEAEPQNAELMLLLGVFLHFDGQAERAAAFFQQAVKLGEGEAAKSFLGKGERRKDEG